MKHISISDYFQKRESLTLLDVRSPGEFNKGHIPGAKNLPLFSDQERAEVGTLYKKQGVNKAMMRGLDLAGAKLTGYVRAAQNKVQGKNVVVHCWRGGKRSSSMGTLLEFMGFKVEVIEGGYKAYRNYVLNELGVNRFDFHVLGGPTGSGKTKILEVLKSHGHQVVNLEKLANHKGSSFGALGQDEQPSTEQFENNLFRELQSFDSNRPVWTENESRSIGKVYLPQGFWDQTVQGHFYEIEVPFEERVENLIGEYGAFPKEELMACLEKVTKRMGGQNVKAAKEAFTDGKLKEATSIALKYYDKAYAHAASKKPFQQKHQLKFDSLNPNKIAQRLVAKSREQKYALSSE